MINIFEYRLMLSSFIYFADPGNVRNNICVICTCIHYARDLVEVEVICIHYARDLAEVICIHYARDLCFIFKLT